MRIIGSIVVAFSVALGGCSTTQEITLVKTSVAKPIQSVSQVLDEGNSSQMNDNLVSALQKQGVTIKATLPLGTTKNTDADALISYVDVWRWDLAMYLKSLTVKLHDAATGDLLAIGRWSDSPLHGFRESRVVMEQLVADLLTKVRGTSK